MIERSIGTCAYGYIVGGGYEGKTKELDDVVAREAELLHKHYNKDVEIRFNSDRESGGAWIKDGKENCSIGLSARLSNSILFNMTADERCALDYKQLKQMIDNPDIIVYETGISLKNTNNNVKSDSKDILLGSEFKDFSSLEEAYNYLTNTVSGLI